MLIHKRAALLRVTLEASFVSAQESKAAGFELLLNICRGALGSDAFVRFMAIAATHFSFWHRMVMGQCERCANFQMTLETGVRRLSRIDDRASAAAGFDVQAARTVARLAPHVLGIFTFCLQSRMSGCAEIAHDLFVASRTFF